MGGAVIRKLHPSGFGFWGGLGLGLLIALFAFGDLARMVTLIAPAEAQFAPSFRLMDGAHNQLATVDHAGRLLVNTGATSGLTDHITSVTHISGAVMIRNTVGTVATLTGTSLDVNCTGCAASVVEVDHVSSVTHIAGAASLVSRAGTYVTVTGTALDVNCTGCAAASVVAVSHISGAVHVVNSFGQALHFQGLGIPGQAHGGVLTVQGITGGVPIPVSLASGGDAVNVFHQSTIRHISSAVHVVGYAGAALHIQGLGTPGQSHGGVLSIQGVNNGNAIAVGQSLAAWNIAHVTSVTHVRGGVFLTSQAGAAITVTGTALDVNCTGCSAASIVAVTHISGAVHVVNASGAALHIQGLGIPGGSHGGVLTVQGITGMNALSISQSVADWNIAHITSVTHVYGRMSLVGRDGTYITFTGTALDVNCSAGCSAGTPIPHISGSLHIAGTIKGAQFHVTGLGLPGQTHGGVFTIQGVTGMIGMAVYQDTPRWTVAHITSVTHVYGSVSLISRDGTYAGFAGTSVLVAASSAQSGSWSIQATHQGGEWNIRHIGGVIHVSIVSSTHLTGAIHVVGLSNIGSGAPGTYTTQMVCHSTLAIHVAAAAPGLTQIIHLTSTNGNVDQTSWRIYICGIMVVSAHAQGFSLFEGTGTTCSTLKRSLIGSYRPDDSVVLAASGGFSAIAPFPWMATQVAGNNLCIGQTSRSTGTISGVISYRAGP